MLFKKFKNREERRKNIIMLSSEELHLISNIKSAIYELNQAITNYNVFNKKNKIIKHINEMKLDIMQEKA